VPRDRKPLEEVVAVVPISDPTLGNLNGRFTMLFRRAADMNDGPWVSVE
jgi:hypothetical protein